MIRRALTILATTALIAALSACHQQQKAGHGEVSGQILPGSISDAMLPYDSVKSTAPLAPRVSTGSANEEPDNNAPDSADTSAADAATAPVIAASPAPAAPAVGN